MTDRIDQIIEKLQQLKEIRQQLVDEAMSPPGAWIHQYEVRKQYKKDGEIYWYVYAKWQANEPIFKRNPKQRLKGIVKRGKNSEYTCHQHIGRVGSSTGLSTDKEVEEAYQEWANRKRLDAIDTAIEEIENALKKVMPEKKR
jgi:CMP-N-acetylneuraminic acid synthetase